MQGRGSRNGFPMRETSAKLSPEYTRDTVALIKGTVAHVRESSSMLLLPVLQGGFTQVNTAGRGPGTNRD